jgi:cytochrome c biogenesis protein
VAGLIGTLVRQVPAFALRDPVAYAGQIEEMHERWDAITILGLNVGPILVETFDRLGFFRVFSAPWFIFALTLLVVSIVVCTLDRTPRLWRGVRRVTVEQPEAFYDLRLSERALFETALPAEAVAAVLRGRRFKVRRAEGPSDAATPSCVLHVYGDRNQYFKMATLLTHLGLILFLAGAAVTTSLGYETVIVVGEGQTAPVQPVGTAHNLVVKNISFEAPTRPDGSAIDFRTDLAVYQDGREVARKTIRVNDPLTVGPFVFHQNTFGPSASLEIRDAGGRLVWTGPVILAGEFLGLPQGFLTIPGSDLGLLVILDRDATGVAQLALQGLGPVDDDGSTGGVFLTALRLGRSTEPGDTAGYTITWSEAGAWTGMVVKNDPGEPIIYMAYVSLMAGLILSFYFPRRRVWARITDGRLQLAMLADRYVDVRREFESLLDELAVRTGRRPMRTPSPRPDVRTG